MAIKIIEGFNNRYSISEDGKVYSMIIPGKGVSDIPVRDLHKNMTWEKVKSPQRLIKK